MFDFLNVRPRSPIRKALFLPGLRLSGLVLGGGLILLCGFVFVGLGLRPELWIAGPEVLSRAFLAGVGTSLPVVFPLLCAGIFYFLARELSGGWQLLGYSSAGLWFRLWPITLTLFGIGLVLTLWLEPTAWSQVDGVWGVPLSARVAWQDLKAGHVRVGPEGSWPLLEGAELSFESGDSLLRGEASRVTPNSAETSWDFRGLEVERTAKEPEVWSFDRLSLGLNEARAISYRAESISPWTAPLTALMEGRSQSPRTRTILGRRLLQLLALPVLSFAFWSIGLSLGSRAGELLSARPAALLALLGYLVLLRFSEGLDSVAVIVAAPLCGVTAVALLRRLAWRR